MARKQPEPVETMNGHPYMAASVAVLGVIVVFAVKFKVMPPLALWGFPLLAVILAVVACAVTFLCTVMQETVRVTDGTGWARVTLFRLSLWVGFGVWTTWVLAAGWGTGLIVSGVLGTAAFVAIGAFTHTPPKVRYEQRGQQDEVDRRHPIIREWEDRIRTVTKIDVVVTHWESWDNPKDGMRLFAELPVDKGTTAADLAGAGGTNCDKLAASKRLPAGCAVRVLDSDRQGVVVVDIMLRNTLVETEDVHREPTTPASINDDFPVLKTPRGEALSVCLRIFSMVVGGTTGSGKTTFLHRLIMWLARCTDALIWVIDLNGGGVAEPWISPWAEGRTINPTVDWIADNEEEAALMVAVAAAIARDRKTNSEARRRKKGNNSMVLPVDAKMPAIIILTDEGGEVRQAVSIFGTLAAKGITRLVQIGRAEAIRGIISVLRGTSDLTDKGFRVNAALRLCLRMEENDEYYHVLGVHPGKTELSGALGAGYLKTPTIPRPVLGRTVNVDLRGIDAHAVACGPLRPKLDPWGLRAASRVNAAAVLGGREPSEELMEPIQMQHAEQGMAYTGRWKRYEPKLAEMRGDDDLAGVGAGDDGDDLSKYRDEPVPVARAAGAPAPRAMRPDSALDRLTLGVDKVVNGGRPAKPASDPVPPAAPANGNGHHDRADNVIAPSGRTWGEPRPTSSAGDADEATIREQILDLLDVQGTMRAEQFVSQVVGSRGRIYDILRDLVSRGVIAKDSSGAYYRTEDRENAI